MLLASFAHFVQCAFSEDVSHLTHQLNCPSLTKIHEQMYMNSLTPSQQGQLIQVPLSTSCVLLCLSIFSCPSCSVLGPIWQLQLQGYEASNAGLEHLHQSHEAGYCWWFRNPACKPVEVVSLSHYLQGFLPSQVQEFSHQQVVTKKTSSSWWFIGRRGINPTLPSRSLT